MKKPFRFMTIFVLSLLLLAGCAQMQELFSGSPESRQAQPVSRYLDFGDVLLPGELSKVAKESFITNGHGRLVLTGRVRGDSLAQYFVTSMESEGWTALNQYTYQGSIKQFFRKNQRMASVLITENPLSTQVEIWVVPLGKI
ncbi:MAG: hypothetical protein WAR22_12695 [Desulfomonilia bacterium]|jgi:hypothetical protein